MTEISPVLRGGIRRLAKIRDGLFEDAYMAPDTAGALLDQIPPIVYQDAMRDPLPTEPGSKARLRDRIWGPYDCLLLQDGSWVDMNDGARVSVGTETAWEPIPEKEQNP